MFSPPHTLTHTLKPISISLLALICIQCNPTNNYHQKIAGNNFFLITSANQISLPALLRTRAPQTHWSQECSKKQMPIDSVSSTHHKELGQESTAFLSDLSEHSVMHLMIFGSLKLRKRSPIVSPNVYVANFSSIHSVIAYPFHPPFGNHPLHQIFPTARLPSLKEVQLYHLTTPSIQLQLLKTLHSIFRPPPALNID
jgi:hypothetical protein